MRKLLYLFIIAILSVNICVLFSSCREKKDYSDYKNEEGYTDYIKYADKGSKYAPYYAIPESFEKSEMARQYYENNVRKCGDFLITDYLDGVCINDYVGDADDNSKGIVIPENLDGKPVIAIGAKRDDDSSELKLYDSFGTWSREYYPALYGADIVMPATIKYIGEYTALGTNSFTVDENNPYYSSENGRLYTKDMKTLLFYNRGSESNAKISDGTEIFAPTNGLVGTWGDSLELGKNIITIDAEYYYETSDEYSKYPFSIKGYKDTVAEKWAKENNINFTELD